MEAVIDTFYNLLRNLQNLWLLLEGIALRKFPQGAIISVVGYVVYCVIKQYKAEKKQRLYWLHSFISICLASFGGGTVAPVLLGKTAGVVATDYYLPIGFVVWYAIFHLGAFDLLYSTPAKVVWSCLVGIYRTHGSIALVNAALSTLKAGPFYPIPVVGPILLAVIAGSMGGFLPYDKGLAAVKNGTPWPIQAPFYSASFYLFMIKDTEGFIGITLRGLLGAWSERTVIVAICTMQMITNLLQNFVDPDANLFTPIHKIMYRILGLQGRTLTEEEKKKEQSSEWLGWSDKVKEQFELIIENSRVLVVIAAIAAFATFYIPTSTLPAVTLIRSSADAIKVGDTVTLQGVGMNGISVGSSVGVCQWAPFLHATDDCSPLALTLQEWRICSPESCSISNVTTSCDKKGCTIGSALDALRNGMVKEIRYRLVSANGTLSDATLQPKIATFGAAEEAAANKGFDASVKWSSPLVKYSNADQLLKIDSTFEDHGKTGGMKLFVSSSGDLFLLSSVQHTFSGSGTIFDPAAVEGKVLWTGKTKSQCSGEGAEIVGLTVNKVTGAPELICSNDEHLALTL